MSIIPFEMKTIYFPSLPAVVPSGSVIRSNSLGLFRKLSKIAEGTGEKLAQKVADPAHPFHLLKAIAITQTAGFTSILAACLSSWIAGLGHGFVAGTIEKKGTEPISAEEIQQLIAAAMTGDWGAMVRLTGLIEKEGDPRVVSHFHEVIVSVEDGFKEIFRDELEAASMDKLTEKAIAGDRLALNALHLVVSDTKSQKALNGLSSYWQEMARSTAKQKPISPDWSTKSGIEPSSTIGMWSMSQKS